MMNQTAFKWRVMLGVYTLYVVRKLKSPFIGEIFALAMFGAVLSFLVSIPHIIGNLMLTHGSYVAYVSDAFSKTQVAVKLVFLAALAALVLFFRNVTLSTTNMIRSRFA